MKEEIFQCPSEVEKIETRKDNTIKLIIGVQEISRDEEAKLMRLRNKLGWFLFSEVPIKGEDLSDIPDFIAGPKGQKSSSQYLKDCMYVYYKTKYGEKFIREDFDVWRRDWLKKTARYFIDKARDYENK